jgi:c-di-GMP-related signal transduction protein
MDVFGYELLFRSGQETSFAFHDGDCASAQVMNHSMLVHGLGTVVEGKKAFIKSRRGSGTRRL